MANDRRVSFWTRWPDEESGPLWVGLHLNQRAGQTVLVGLEMWTEAPGNARQSLGPAAPESDELLPWPPLGIHRDDLRRVRFRDLLERLWASIREDELARGWEPHAVGRPKIYDDAHYERVSGVYIRAVKAGRRDPVRAVAETWNINSNTAKGWVAKARRAGWLQATARKPRPSGSIRKDRMTEPFV